MTSVNHMPCVNLIAPLRGLLREVVVASLGWLLRMVGVASLGGLLRVVVGQLYNNCHTIL
jgi:hypothetical protein